MTFSVKICGENHLKLEIHVYLMYKVFYKSVFVFVRFQISH